MNKQCKTNLVMPALTRSLTWSCDKQEIAEIRRSDCASGIPTQPNVDDLGIPAFLRRTERLPGEEKREAPPEK
jgi:hypothetical protein